MSKIILNTENIAALPNPVVGEYYLAVDTDGLLKLRRQTDTITLGLTGSIYLSSNTVTFSEFDTLVGSSGLNTGDVYIISDFKTRNYIQYTDASGDGTGGSEDVNTGTGEQLCVLATSPNTYDNKVRSTTYPDDLIIWEHSVADRQYDHAGGVLSTGHILYRKSVNGNERDYDFRGVTFRRWNDGWGNYTVIREIDATVPGDYIDTTSLDENYHNNNKVGSSMTQSGSIYYMDNLVFGTPSYVAYNNIKRASGGNVTSNDFTNNNIGESINTDYFGDVITTNEISSTSDATFSTTVNNNIGVVENSNFGTMSNNNIRQISNSNIGDLNNNNLDTISYQISTTVENNKGGTITSNSSSLISDNTFIEVSGNTASTILSNKSDRIISNVTSATISYNSVSILSNNTNVGEISYNNGYEISLNTGTGSINNNNANSILSNILGGDLSYNTSRLIATNSTGTLSKNTVDEISLNTKGIITNNKGNLLSTNSIDLIDSNSVDIILSNSTASNITQNVSYEISWNSGNVVRNKVLDIKFNSSNVRNNIGSTVSLNTSSDISNNKVDNIQSNTVTTVSDNIGETILSNLSTGASSLTFNNVMNIEANNGIGTMSGNLGKSIRLNTVSIMENNDVFEVLSNTNTTIRGNKSQLIESNIDTTLNGGIIESNIVDTIDQNINFSEIRYNNGNIISTNTWAADKFSGATAGFTFTSATLSVGDYAIIDINGTTFSVISTTTSASGFIDEIYTTFPQFGFSGTYSGSDFTVTQPISVISYEGSPFSLSMNGTYSAPINTAYSGAGLNDILIDATAFTTPSQIHYLVFINSEANGGPNDTFGWYDDQGNSASNVLVSGSYSTLSYGVQVAFGNSTGHTISDNWDFDVASGQSQLGVSYTTPFTGESTQNISKVTYNNVNRITNNKYNSITNNTGNEITGNTTSNYYLSNNTTGNIVNGTNSFSVVDALTGNNILGVTDAGVEVGTLSTGTVVGNLVIDDNNRITSEGYVSSVLTLESTVIPVSNATEEYYGASGSTPMNITLPLTTTLRDGKKMIFKDESGNASSNPVTISSWTGSLIDGATSSTISTDHGYTSLIKRGDNWWIV